MQQTLGPAKPKRPTVRSRIKKAVNWPGKAATRQLEAWMGKGSLVGDKPVFDNKDFPWARMLEENWETIRGELEGVLPTTGDLPTMQYISKTQRKIIKTDGWKTYFFRAYGQRAEENCRRCPETARLLERIPDLELAFFSILAPGSHISAHRGVYKGLLRAHLGLIVPAPSEDVRMSVGDEMIYWKEGTCVVFDDTFRHEVWNDTDGVRVVLLLDVHRPLPAALDRLNRAILRVARVMPFVTEPVKKHREWEKAFYGKS
ncbi:aspartyl/asparaginyl beta-hydroxylase domain-containing protein [Acuticoccus mangrovi]|uniref:Aspartyl/asparaginyl beta-hydroxylase domain-containing protein n=1 Tax=Acuticoccus mangrovi TaxID=2796142 RepID=A0A934MFA5_9HYPH|nr:aspartyl/asparaginyl beta-hydroxylase domain-containing protein [Acuticoccus mangrovi]MBJ3775258.1 aspartyl/asparaginyl beta-hydroxylase domain-containing protein [Acuticoccus mangrovi]